jgi:hypothetical protein
MRLDLAASHEAYLRRRYEVLFWSLLFTLVATPVCASLAIPQTVVQLFLAANLLAAIAPLEKRTARRTVFALFGLLVLARLTIPAGWLFGTTFVVGTLLGIFAAGAALRHAIGAPTVTREHVYAGLSAYLLAGLFCGHLYWVMEHHTPGSVAMPAGGPLTLADGIYFSFATLTTVGYGDIVARTEVARGVATLEAVAGQLYLAVLVARLIGLYVSRKAK